MKILISPAKSINENCSIPASTFSQPLFHKEAKSLVTKLKKFKSKDLMDLMHVSKDIAELNVNRFKAWKQAEEPTDHVKPAAYLFTGEVYRGLDIPTLSETALERAQSDLRILSGLYGLLKPLDLIFPYRLEMGTKWEISDKAANLYQFWGEKLTKSLLKETDKTETIVNLASTEYSKAIQWKKVKQAVVTPVFKEFKNGEYKVVMMYAKHQRGKMTRWILENNPQDAEALKLYQEDGYQFSEPLSSTNEWVFVR